MSLQVWLPLNGNINNQGLYELPAPVFNQFIYGDGKIGQSAKKRIGWHLENEVLGNEWSVMTWLHVAGTFAPSSHNLIFCKNISTSTDCQIYFSITGGAKSLNIGVNGPATSLQYNYNFTTNTWYHVGATYDGTTVSLYLNGDRVATKEVTTAYPEGRINMQLGGRSQNQAGTSTFEVCDYDFNDFRLYDHCLSLKEMKEISKGLVLHYKLDNNGLGNPNLVIESQRLSNEFSQYASHWKRSFQIENGQEIWTATCIAASTIDKAGGPHTSIFKKSDNPDRIGKTYTWSCWVRSNRDINYLTIGSETGGGKNCVITTEWQYFSNTWVCTDTQYESFIWYLKDPIPWAVGDWIQVKDMKIEEGNCATPWCPHVNDNLYNLWGMNSLTETDCSGYFNDGVKSNILNSSGDTIRNNSSMCIKDLESINLSNLNYETMQNGTLSFWIKFNSFPVGKWSHYIFLANGFNWTGQGQDFIIVSNLSETSTKICLDCCSYTSSHELNLNQWYHITIAWDAVNYQIYKYINGNLVYTHDDATNKRLDTYRNKHNTHGIGNIAKNSKYSGDFSISDFRIYSTTLNADDILELYKVSAFVDKNDNLYAHRLLEKNTSQIYKTGIMEHNEIIENFGINRVEEEMWGKSYSYIPVPGNNKCITPIVVDMTQYKTGTKIYVQADIEWSGFEATDANGQALTVQFQGDNYIPEREEFDWDSPNPQPIAIALRKAVNYDLTSVVLSVPQGKKTLFGSHIVDSDVYPTLWPKARLGVRTNYSNGVASFTLSNVKVMFEQDYSGDGFKINKERLVANQFYEV